MGRWRGLGGPRCAQQPLQRRQPGRAGAGWKARPAACTEWLDSSTFLRWSFQASQQLKVLPSWARGSPETQLLVLSRVVCRAAQRRHSVAPAGWPPAPSAGQACCQGPPAEGGKVDEHVRPGEGRHRLWRAARRVCCQLPASSGQLETSAPSSWQPAWRLATCGEAAASASPWDSMPATCYLYAQQCPQLPACLAHSLASRARACAAGGRAEQHARRALQLQHTRVASWRAQLPALAGMLPAWHARHLLQEPLPATLPICPADKPNSGLASCQEAMHADPCASAKHRWLALQTKAALSQGHMHLLLRGMAISSRPKKTFWKPPETPGCTTQATEGVGRPAAMRISTCHLSPCTWQACGGGQVRCAGAELGGSAEALWDQTIRLDAVLAQVQAHELCQAWG